jgi:hypothetical protein
MISLANLFVHIIEGVAVTIAIYLVTRKQLNLKEIMTLSIMIAITFLLLDLFAPGVALGARQGSGFGLGFTQVAGSPTGMPRHYYDPGSGKIKVIEGMDDEVALKYYGQYNPGKFAELPPQLNEPNIVIGNANQIPSIILQNYTQNPYTNDTTISDKYAEYAN